MHLISAPGNLLISLTSGRGAKILIYAPLETKRGCEVSRDGNREGALRRDFAASRLVIPAPATLFLGESNVFGP